MITATISESAPRLTRPRSPLGPLCLWSVIQIAVLCLSAGQVPLAPTKGFPDPPELFATPFMIGVQIGIAALLFPYLMRDLLTSALVIAASWPFTAMAQALAGQLSREHIAFTVCYVSFCLVCLALWRIALPSSRAKAIGIALATLLSLGGTLLAYFRCEYALGSSADLTAFACYSPILGALVVSTHDFHIHAPWIMLAIHLILALFATGISRFLTAE